MSNSIGINDATIIKRMIAGKTGMASGAIKYSHSSYFKAEVFELNIVALGDDISTFQKALANAGAKRMSASNGTEIWHLPETWKNNIEK